MKAYIVHKVAYVTALLQAADLYSASKVFVQVIFTNTENITDANFEIAVKLLAANFSKTSNDIVFFGVEGVGGYAVQNVNTCGICQDGRIGWLTLASMIRQLGFDCETDDNLFIKKVTHRAAATALRGF